MASRQEEKERRRREREEAERAAAEKARRGRRLKILGGAAAALVVIIVVAVVIASSGGSSSAGKVKKASTPQLAAAAQKAGCKLRDYPKGYEDRGHTNGTVRYKTNPPAFGPHNPIPAQDGDYVGRTTPATEHLVHALEHGRIEVQYRKGTPKSVTDQLEKLFNEDSDYMLVFQNETNMPYQVAAVAWTHVMGCPQWNANVPDAITAFRGRYQLKAPEHITQPE
jgi:hypothetical protein